MVGIPAPLHYRGENNKQVIYKNKFKKGYFFNCELIIIPALITQFSKVPYEGSMQFDLHKKCAHKICLSNINCIYITCDNCCSMCNESDYDKIILKTTYKLYLYTIKFMILV